MAEEYQEDDFDEELEEEMEKEVKKPVKKEKRNDTGPEEVEEVSQDRYVVRAEPETVAILDTVTKEVIAGFQQDLKTSQETLVDLQLKAKQLNEIDSIKNSLG